MDVILVVFIAGLVVGLLLHPRPRRKVYRLREVQASLLSLQLYGRVMNYVIERKTRFGWKAVRWYCGIHSAKNDLFLLEKAAMIDNPIPNNNL